MTSRSSLFYHVIVVISSIMATFTGCQTRTAQEPVPEREREINFVPIHTPDDKNPLEGRNPSTLPSGELEAIQNEEVQSTLFSFKIDSAITGAKNWEAADRVVRDRLEGIRNLRFAYKVEQVAANRMLSTWLLKGDRSDGKDQAVAFYTELLLRNNHPDAAVIGDALEILQKHWPKERISDAAAKTVRNAQAYLQKNPCKPCLEGMIVSEEALDARQKKLYRMNHAATALAKMTVIE